MRFIVGWPWKFEIIGILCHGYSWNFLNRFKISMRSFWAKIQEKISKLDFWQLKWKLFIYDGNSRNLMVLKSCNFLWLIAKWRVFCAPVAWWVSATNLFLSKNCFFCYFGCSSALWQRLNFEASWTKMKHFVELNWSVKMLQKWQSNVEIASKWGRFHK